MHPDSRSSTQPSTHALLRQNKSLRYAALGVSVLALAAWILWPGTRDVSKRPALPEPIIQGQQLRFPANHPQLALLTTEAATAAQRMQIDLPARLIWNEERTQRIYPAFAGRVAQMRADVGQTVQAGQVLATLASPEFGAAQADAAKAQADADLTERALSRQKTLFEADVISRKELELAQADAARAKAELSRAQARAQLYGGAGHVNQLMALTALVPGVVVERNLSAGLEVRPDQGGPALFVISDPTTLWVQLDARESDAAALKPGTRIRLTLPNLPDQSFEARVTASGDFIDSNTRTVKVRAVIDNKQRQLKAEMLGTAHIERPLSSGVLVPATAIQLRGTEHWTYVQTAPGVFEPRQVRVGFSGPQEVWVTEGLQAGEQVVKDNGLLLAREFRIAQEEAQRLTEKK